MAGGYGAPISAPIEVEYQPYDGDSMSLLELRKEMAESQGIEAIEGVDSAALQIKDRAAMNAKFRLPTTGGDQRWTRSKEEDAARENYAKRVAYATTRQQTKAQEYKGKAKSAQVEKALKSLNEAYIGRGRALQTYKNQKEDAYIKNFAREMLGMDKDLYN